MLAVLYVGHGTRVSQGVEQARAFLYRCMEAVAAPIQEICYLEIVRPDIQEGIRRCAEQGADVIVLQPLLLLSAGHAKRDIPCEIEKARARYPNITFLYGRPFGVDEGIIDIVVERLHERTETLSDRSGVLLVGRGSSDPQTQKDFEAICHLLRLKGITNVKTCYMAAIAPSFNDGLDLALAESWEKIYVVPYLLFTGLLMRTIRRSIERKGTNSDSVVLCRPIGYHNYLVRLMKKRIGEVLPNELSAGRRS